jgi:hypothetical protein
MNTLKTLLRIILPLALLLGFYCIASLLKRTDTIPLLLTYSSLFLLLWLWLKKYSSLASIFILGLLIRGVFIFYIPELSQDFYRFIWDGNIQLLGINPYLYTPDVLIELIGFPNDRILYEGYGITEHSKFFKLSTPQSIFISRHGIPK